MWVLYVFLSLDCPFFFWYAILPKLSFAHASFCTQSVLLYVDALALLTRINDRGKDSSSYVFSLQLSYLASVEIKMSYHQSFGIGDRVTLKRHDHGFGTTKTAPFARGDVGPMLNFPANPCMLQRTRFTARKPWRESTTGAKS